MNTSPIELLKEVMAHTSALGSTTVSEKVQVSKKSVDSLVLGEQSSKPSNSPLDFSMKEKLPAGTGKLPTARNGKSLGLH